MGLENVRLHEEVGGEFLVHDRVRSIPADRMMPTEEVLPGVLVPLLLVPNIEAKFWDEDHARFESHDPRLVGGNGYKPLRYSMVQYLPRPVHQRKNDRYDAVEVPQDPHAIFQAVLLGAFKYVTRYGLDVSDKESKIVEFTDSERLRFHQEGWVRTQRGTDWRIGFYLAKYALTNGVQAIRDTEEVSRFIDAKSDAERKFASFGVVRRAAEIVLDPIEPTYEIARRKGAIRRPEPTATRFLTRYFDSHQPDYVPVLAEELLAA
jgi:hypothetical protein